MGTYLIVIGRTATGYSAHCPDVLGCITVGKTIEQVIGNMKKSLELHFDGMAEDGDPIPKPGDIDAFRATMKEFDLKKYVLAHVQI